MGRPIFVLTRIIKTRYRGEIRMNNAKDDSKSNARLMNLYILTYLTSLIRQKASAAFTFTKAPLYLANASMASIDLAAGKDES